jgi:hypothetical protein
MPVNKQPQAISDKTWEAIKAACISGMGFSAAARAFGINNVHTIIMKCRRNQWPIPARIRERAKALQEGRDKAHKLARERSCNSDQALEALAQDWVSRGEAHRAIIYELTNAALRKVSKQPPPLENWSDIERCDKAGRRATGLDHEEAHNISLGLQLVNQRIEAAYLTLPKDALSGPDSAPEGLSRSDPLQNGSL